MSRYIDVDVALELKNNVYYDIRQIEEFLDDVPSADVVEVVRCRDCKHCFEKNAVGVSLLYCALNSHYTLETNFCNYGERREQ